jgi:hypothetical protein
VADATGMVRIRRADTLEEREVPEGALPFFTNQGWEVGGEARAAEVQVPPAVLDAIKQASGSSTAGTKKGD